ncbi:hypothetical protein Tco_0276942 [Tanacetum coccineum]
MTVDDLIKLVPQLVTRIDSLQTYLKQSKLTIGSAIMKLVKKVKKLEGLVTPSKTTVNASGEEQVEDISPNTLEAAKTLSSVASQKPKSIDKGRRYKRRKKTKEKKVVTSLDFQEEVSIGYAERVNTGSIKVSTVSGQVSTVSGQKLLRRLRNKFYRRDALSCRMLSDWNSLEKEEEAKQVHLDSLLAQRLAEEEELNEQQNKRRAQVQFEAQHYTDEDWDLIRAKIEANAELSKSVLGSDLQGEVFAKKMVELNLSFEEVKEEFDKLVKQVESFAPINFEATKDNLKRFGEELQTKNSKRLKSDEEKGDVSTKKTGKRRKQIAKKGLHSDKTDKDESEASKDADPILGEKGVYQIVREDGTDIVYINFGAMLKDITRDDLTELYRIVMNRYGMNGPEDELEKTFWKYLKNMFEPPLSIDLIWSLLDKKLQGGKPDEDCYKMLKMMEKQAGIRK